ncbi:MAG: dephospho-CoA kinase [Pseudomonadota bacterium]
MTFLLGLTGSIGMGKSTTAAMFADEGCAVWDADAAVHRLYAKGGAAVQPMAKAFPHAVQNQVVDREMLKSMIASDKGALRRIETIVHPLVARDRGDFIREATADVVVLDIPLLFETGAESQMDAVACVEIAADVQRQRVLERGTMTETQFDQILMRQMPNADKCANADFVIVTDTIDHTRAQVQDVVRQIRKELVHA